MPKTPRKTGLLVLPLVAFTGCATIDPRPDYDRASRHIVEATDHETTYTPGDDQVVADKTDALLADGLTAQEAVQIALLNNPTLQAAFASVGIARADLVQSGLLSNPTLGVSARFPSGGGLPNFGAELAENIADLWQIPARKRAAAHSLDRAILELARDAAVLATDAKSAYFDAVGADQRNTIASENLSVAHTILELAQARQQAGAGTELDVNLSRNLVLDAELAVESTRLDAAEARRKLATLLGLTSNADDLRLVDALPDIPREAPDSERLITTARGSRLDIQAAEQAVDAAEAKLREQIRRVFPTVELGVALERGERKAQGGRDVLADTARTSVANGQLTAPEIQPRSQRRTHTDFIIGPSLGLELPIFDQNQAQIAKARYEYDQTMKTLDALDRAVTQEVRGAVDRALTAWRLAQAYRDRSVPLAKSNLDLSQEAYRAGRTSFVSVLEAERFFLDARSRYVDAARTAAKAVPELERVIGLPFDRFIIAVEAPSAPEKQKPLPQGQNP